MTNRWFLISDHTVRDVRRALETAMAGDADNRECYRDALHYLDSGLHITPAIPSDYQEAGASSPAIRAADVRKRIEEIRREEQEGEDS